VSKRTGKPLVDPRTLASNIAYSALVQYWRSADASIDLRTFVGPRHVRIGLDRVIYYDGRPDGGANPLIEEYWKAIELLKDTEIGFGAVRFRGKERQQKRVDSLIAVDMLEGAFTHLFQVAILIAADSDFVPVVEAVRRRGVMVVVAASEPLADELRRVADRIWLIDATGPSAEFPSLWRPDGKVWFERQDASVELGVA
jgi:uncharacterized LabA/DUF88 family protein